MRKSIVCFGFAITLLFVPFAGAHAQMLFGLNAYVGKKCTGAIGFGSNADTFSLKDGALVVKHTYSSRFGDQTVEVPLRQSSNGSATMKNPNTGAEMEYLPGESPNSLTVMFQNGRYTYKCSPAP
jgi:hypothetical protein